MKTFSMIAIATLSMAGVAFAGDPKDAKAPAAKDAKAPAAGAPAAKAEPKMPSPPAEIAEMGKAVSGTWKCKGESPDMAGGKMAFTATNKGRVDLDKWWVVENMEVKGGKMLFKMDAYTTFDAASKKWRRVAVDNHGSYMVGTSDGLKDNKMDWNLDGVGPEGAYMFRDHFDGSDMKAGAKIWGEMSMDKGKTWMKVYEMSCTK